MSEYYRGFRDGVKKDMELELKPRMYCVVLGMFIGTVLSTSISYWIG